MDLTPYLASVAQDLDKVTALADDQVRDVAHRLVAALEPGLRIALVRAVSDTAAQINTDLDEAVVTVTMSAGEPMVNVTSTPSRATADPPPAPPGPPAPPEPADVDGGLARITLRVPDQLKTRAEELSAEAGQSLNTWLVHAVRRATTEAGHRPRTRGTGRVSGWA